MKTSLLILCLILSRAPSASGQANPPELASWLRNTTGLTGYNSLPANVQLVRYSAGNVYVSSSDIPAYSIGPWPGDPNVPANQGFVLKLPRHPVMNNGTKTSTPLGPIGVWINGVAVFNALDAQSYNNQNIWHQNAVVVEASSFDACLGHPAPGGVYHHHQNPRCLYAADSSSHSPLIGYTFDGFPVYGPYGYTNPDGSGGIKRLRSSYRPRNITQRTSLPDGTVLSPSQYGPDVSVTYPLGYYVEDFEYADGSGDLDRYNGRLTVTPDYPDSVYAYVATVDSDGNSAYPYFVGPQYYGVVETGNITSHGHVAVSESVMTYSPETAIREGDPHPLPGRALLSQNYPNPFNPSTTIRFAIPGSGFVVLSVFDVVGREVATLASRELTAGEYDRTWIAPGEASGVYYCRLRFTPDQGGSPSQAAPFVTTKKLLLLR